METKYTLDYFIEKFEKIPSEKWCTGQIKKEDRCCAFGHCGATDLEVEALGEEAKALIEVVGGCDPEFDWDIITNVNDAITFTAKELGTTPKERVVNYLKSLKQ